MRVGLLTQYFPPEMGAPQARLSEFATHVTERGHEVVVLTAMPNYPTGRVFDGYGGVLRRERRDGVSVSRTFIWPTRRVDLLPRVASYVSFAASSAITGAATLGRLDVLLTESPPLLLGPTGWALSRLTRSRLVFNVSDLWPDSAIRMGALSGARAKRLAFGLEAFCYRRAWAVSGQSEEILSDISSRFPAVRTYHFSNGVDTVRFSPAHRSEAVRASMFEGRSVVILYAGLHGLAQGLDRVLHAARAWKGRGDVGFFFVGDGAVKEALQQQAKDAGLSNVFFSPPVPKQDMPAVVASADIALVPLATRLPGAVPSKLYEAMASGVPVVLAAGGEAAAIVESSACGLNAPPGDAAAIESAIRRLVEDPAMRESFGRAGREAAVRRFDRAQICGRFIDWLEATEEPAPVRASIRGSAA